MIFLFLLLAFSLSLFLVFITLKFCQKHNIYDKVDPRKVHNGNIPRLGGIGIFVSFFAVSGLCAVFYKEESFLFAWQIFAGLALIFTVGLLDDFFDIPAKLKFLAQIIAALVVTFSPFYIDTVFDFNLHPVAGRIITFCWIIGCTNAFNLIDGIDWLCSGISLLSFLTLGFINLEFAKTSYLLYFIIALSIAGFMVWNKPPAKIFLGDSGSQSLGFAMATFPLFMEGTSSFEYNKLLIMFLLASIPCTDVIAAVWRRKRDHRHIFSADRSHIHHKLLNVGFSKITSIVFLLFIQLIVCFSVIMSCYMKTRSSLFVLIIALCFVILFFIMFHYLNRTVNLKHKGHLEDHPQEEHTIL